MNNSGEEVNEEEQLVWIRNISLCRSGGDTLPLSFLESLSGEQVLSLWGIEEVRCSYGSLDGRHARSTIMLRILSLGQCGMTSSSCPLQENDVIVRVLGDPVTSLLHLSQLFRFCDSLTVDVLRKKERSTCPSKTHIVETHLLPSDDDHNGIIALPSHDSSQDQQDQENNHNYYLMENHDNAHNQQSHHEHMIFQTQGEDQHYAEKRLIQRIRNHIILLPEQEQENPNPNNNTSYAATKIIPQQDSTPKEVFVLPSPNEANHNQQSILPQLQDIMQLQEQDVETQHEQPRFLWFNCELNDTNTIAENSTNANPLHPHHHTSRNCTQMPTNNSLDSSSRFYDTIPNRTRTDSITSINHTSCSTNTSNKMKPLPTAVTANLPAAKTKLKRLWPNSSIFQKRIMKWIPPGEENNIGILPCTMCVCTCLLFLFVYFILNSNYCR